MKKIDSKDVCSYKFASSLDKGWRYRLQKPSLFLNPYIKPGMTGLDFGCGNGFCTLDIARLMNGNGKIVAADLQQEMLELLKKKVSGSPFEKNISFHKCEQIQTGIKEHFDFMLLFWMFHEVPNQGLLLKELKSLLNAGGKIMISEPKVHVKSKSFLEEKQLAQECGFNVEEGPEIFFSRTMILSLDK